MKVALWFLLTTLLYFQAFASSNRIGKPKPMKEISEGQSKYSAKPVQSKLMKKRDPFLDSYQKYLASNHPSFAKYLSDQQNAVARNFADKFELQLQIDRNEQRSQDLDDEMRILSTAMQELQKYDAQIRQSAEQRLNLDRHPSSIEF